MTVCRPLDNQRPIAIPAPRPPSLSPLSLSQDHPNIDPAPSYTTARRQTTSFIYNSIEAGTLALHAPAADPVASEEEGVVVEVVDTGPCVKKKE